MGNQIEGFFLEFTGDEIKEIREELERQGYEPDASGLKAALLDSLFAPEDETEAERANDETERIIRKAKRFVEDNPATVKFGMDAIVGLMKMATGKARR